VPWYRHLNENPAAELKRIRLDSRQKHAGMTAGDSIAQRCGKTDAE
jgi:hypothetical protein